MKGKVFTGSDFGIAPERTAHRNNIEKTMTTVFEQYGYSEVTLPMYEHYDVLKNISQNWKDSQMISFTNRSNGKTMVLRPDFTPQVCRMMAGYHKDYPMPVRMYYRGAVFSNVDTDKGYKAEKYQIGCELYGADEASGDIELFLCTKSILANAGLEDYHIVIGDARFLIRIGELLGDKQAEFSEILCQKHLYLHKEFIGRLDAPAPLKKLLLNLPTLFGNDDSLTKIEKMSSFDPVLKERCEYLQSIVKTFKDLKLDSSRFVFDLSGARGLDYYTGIIFEIVHTQTGALLGGGGRYDNLMKKFQLNCTACGMGLYLNEIEILVSSEPREILADWIVVGRENLAKAEELRAQGKKVVYLNNADDIDRFTLVVKAKNILTV